MGSMTPSKSKHIGSRLSLDELLQRKNSILSTYPVPFLLLSFSLFIVLLWLLTIPLLFLSHATPPLPLHYSIVIDCGSTGTRLYVYTWTRGASPASLPLVHSTAPPGSPAASRGRAYHRKETEPGLDKYLGDASGLREQALSPLLTWALQQVPVSSRPSTPIFLLATAGLRRLPAPDATWLLQQCRGVLAGSPFQFQPGWARIISGMDEALYGWMALNYQLGRLAGPGSGTVGALDLGGSSLEVTFAAAGVPPAPFSANVTLPVPGAATFQLYAHSHAGYGMNDAFDASVARLLLRADAQAAGSGSGSRSVAHPCLHTGYNSTYVPKHSRGKGEGEGEVTLLGAAQWEACQALAADVVAQHREEPGSATCARVGPTPCALGAHQPAPAPGVHFVGLAGFYVVHHFFGLPPNASLAQLADAGRQFCGLPWPAVAARQGEGEDYVRGLDRYCFRAPYVVALLTQGLGLRDAQVSVGSGDMGWTLGAALYEGLRHSSRWEEGEEEEEESGAVVLPLGWAWSVAWLLLPLAALCSITSLLLLLLWARRQRQGAAGRRGTGTGGGGAGPAMGGGGGAGSAADSSSSSSRSRVSLPDSWLGGLVELGLGQEDVRALQSATAGKHGVRGGLAEGLASAAERRKAAEVSWIVSDRGTSMASQPQGRGMTRRVPSHGDITVMSAMEQAQRTWVVDVQSGN